jgi:hypothetical protein
MALVFVRSVQESPPSVDVKADVKVPAASM